MPTKKIKTLPPFSELVQQGFTALREHSVLFLTLSLIGYVPMLLIAMAMQANLASFQPLDGGVVADQAASIQWAESGGPQWMVALSLLNIVASLWYGFIFAVMINAAGLYFQNKKKLQSMTALELIGQTMGKLGAIVGTNIIAGVALALLFLLLIIPGIIYSVYWAFIGEVVLFTKLSGMDAMNKSKQLVEGRWWSIFWYTLGFMLISSVISMSVNGVRGYIAALLPQDINYVSLSLMVIAQFAISALVFSRVSLYFSLNEMGRSK